MDADIDKLMGKRTEKRPVAAGRVPPARAIEFALALSAASFVLLASLANVLCAVLALVGNLFYVLVYTRWLKRSTPSNIVIGGAAGAVPPLVGWSAATGNLTLPALYLFLVVFLWTPPHFWALALLIRRNYEAAKVPMLPVVRGERETVRQILLYSLVLVGVTLLPLTWSMFGVGYTIAALVLGGDLHLDGVAVAARRRPRAARRCCSTTPCCTSRCSSSRWPSTRSWACERAGGRAAPLRHARCEVTDPSLAARAQERALRARAVRAVAAALRGSARCSYRSSLVPARVRLARDMATRAVSLRTARARSPPWVGGDPPADPRSS